MLIACRAMLLTILMVEEGPPPLIDLDGTVLLQWGLFFLMWGILHFTLFRPYLKMRGERDRGIAGAKEEAHGMRTRADQMMENYQGQLSRARLRGQEERLRLRTEAVARERELVGVARAQAQKTLDA